MITLPPPFVAIQHPGYFWNTEDKRLYTIKVAGILRPLTRVKGCYANDMNPGYNISVDGIRRYLHEADLLRLTLVDSVIPMENEPNKRTHHTVPTYSNNMGKHYNPAPSHYRNRSYRNQNV